MPSKMRLKELKVYRPLPKFPPISVTGKGCYLNCKHCGRKYLSGMINASARDLYEIVKKLVDKVGINGVLISGGLNQELKVPIPWDVVKKLKRDFDLKINVHVGFIDKNDIEKLLESEVDVVSLDFVADDKVIEDVYGIKKKSSDYIEMMIELEESNIPYAPHITIGLDWGTVHWEYDAVKYLVDRRPKVVVFNVLIPTKGTLMEFVTPPSAKQIEDFFVYSRKLLPNVELSLGCMRPRDVNYEIVAIKSEFDRIVLPRKEILKMAQKNYDKVTFLDTCCVV